MLLAKLGSGGASLYHMSLWQQVTTSVHTYLSTAMLSPVWVSSGLGASPSSSDSLIWTERSHDKSQSGNMIGQFGTIPVQHNPSTEQHIIKLLSLFLQSGKTHLFYSWYCTGLCSVCCLQCEIHHNQVQGPENMARCYLGNRLYIFGEHLFTYWWLSYKVCTAT